MMNNQIVMSWDDIDKVIRQLLGIARDSLSVEDRKRAAILAEEMGASMRKYYDNDHPTAIFIATAIVYLSSMRICRDISKGDL